MSKSLKRCMASIAKLIPQTYDFSTHIATASLPPLLTRNNIQKTLLSQNQNRRNITLIITNHNRTCTCSLNLTTLVMDRWVSPSWCIVHRDQISLIIFKFLLFLCINKFFMTKVTSTTKPKWVFPHISCRC